MISEFNEKASAAVDRYAGLLNTLRAQSDNVFRRGATDEVLRNEALSVAQGAARAFLSLEQAQINEDTADVARSAHSAALEDLGLPDATIDDRFADFIFSSAYFVTRMIAAQAERDVMTMAQHIQSTALRVDIYVRSGRHTPTTAATQVMIEDRQLPAFRFVDRLGRNFKVSKHIRDTYRQYLLRTYNEIYMDVVASHGHTTVRVDHPNMDYKWFDAELAIVTGGQDPDIPLYYDLRDEIFHPSSDAIVTIREIEE